MLKIITATFDYPGSDKYARCLKALRSSIEQNVPDAHFVVIELDPPKPIEGVYQGWLNNHSKLLAYAHVGVDAPTIFIDTDTLVLRDPMPLFDEDFDIAIGRRPSGRAPFNGGVVFMKPTSNARWFLNEWANVDSHMIYDQVFHEKWRAKYRGQNQASFGFLYEMPYRNGSKIYEYPTGVMNACEQDWEDILVNRPYIVHVRKRLLEYAQSDQPTESLPSKIRDAARLWRMYAEG